MGGKVRRPRRTVRCQALDLRLEPRHHACLLPQLDGVAVHQLLGKPLGFFVIIAIDHDAVLDTAVSVDDESVVAPGRNWLFRRLQSRGSQPFAHV